MISWKAPRKCHVVNASNYYQYYYHNFTLKIGNTTEGRRKSKWSWLCAHLLSGPESDYNFWHLKEPTLCVCVDILISHATEWKDNYIQWMRSSGFQDLDLLWVWVFCSKSQLHRADWPACTQLTFVKGKWNWVIFKFTLQYLPDTHRIKAKLFKLSRKRPAVISTAASTICNFICCCFPTALIFQLYWLRFTHPTSPFLTFTSALNLELKFLSLSSGQIYKCLDFHANCSRTSVRFSQALQNPGSQFFPPCVSQLSVDTLVPLFSAIISFHRSLSLSHYTSIYVHPGCFRTSYMGNSLILHQYGRPRVGKHLREQNIVFVMGRSEYPWEIRLFWNIQCYWTTRFWPAIQKKLRERREQGGLK